jgi:hypothetical protein
VRLQVHRRTADDVHGDIKLIAVAEPKGLQAAMLAFAALYRPDDDRRDVYLFPRGNKLREHSFRSLGAGCRRTGHHAGEQRRRRPRGAAV